MKLLLSDLRVGAGLVALTATAAAATSATFSARLALLPLL